MVASSTKEFFEVVLERMRIPDLEERPEDLAQHYRQYDEVRLYGCCTFILSANTRLQTPMVVYKVGELPWLLLRSPQHQSRHLLGTRRKSEYDKVVSCSARELEKEQSRRHGADL